MKLVGNIENAPFVTIGSDVDVVIDLNGYNITFAENAYFMVDGGELEITGEGTVEEGVPYDAPVKIRGNKTNKYTYSKVTIGENVTLKGWAGIFVTTNDAKPATAYGVQVKMNGHIVSTLDKNNDAGHGIYVNGSIVPTEGYVPTITVGKTARIESQGTGIYAAGYAKWDISGSVQGVTGIEIRAGELTVREGAVVEGGKDTWTDPIPEGNGTTTRNAAIAVAQHTTKLPITVNIEGGTFSGTRAFNQEDVQQNGEDAVSKISLSIENGKFTGGICSENFTTASNSGFISGGIFDSKEAESYLAENFMLEGDPDNGYYANVIDGEHIAADNRGGRYLSIVDAFAKAPSGATITMYENETVNNAEAAVSSGKSFVLDLAGKKVSFEGRNGKITVQGELTIKDSMGSGALEASSTANPYFITVSGVLALESGNLSTGNNRVVYLIDNGSFEMAGGSLTSPYAALYAYGKNASVAITGGSVVSTNSSSAKTAISVAGKSVSLTIGAAGVYDSPRIEGKVSLPKDYEGVINFAGGMISGVTVDGGAGTLPEGSVLTSHFGADISSCLPSGMRCVQEDDHWVVKPVSEDTAKAKIVNGNSEELFGSAQAAAAALEADDELILLDDVEGMLTISTGNVTVDLNGHSVSNDQGDYGIRIKGSTDDGGKTVTVKNSGAAATIAGGKASIMVTMSVTNIEMLLDYQGNNITLQPESAGIVLDCGHVEYVQGETEKLVTNGGFKAKASDGKEYVYGTFGAAAAASSDGRVVLLNDYEGATPISVSSSGSVVLDLGGHTYSTSADDIVNINVPNVTMTVENGKLVSASQAENPAGVLVFDTQGSEKSNINLKLDGVEVEMQNDGTALMTHGTNKGLAVVVKESTLATQPGGMGIYFPSADSTLNIVDSSITAGTGIGIKGGTVTVSGDSAVHATGQKTNPSAALDSGINNTGDAIYVEGNYGTSRDVQVNIEGGTFESDNGDAVNMLFAPEDGQTGGNAVQMEVTGGTFDDESAEEYLADGFELVENPNGGFGVQEGEPEPGPGPTPSPDPAPAEEVEAAIDALPAAGDVTFSDKAAIEAARDAYDALSSDEKNDVSNYADLVAAESALAAVLEHGFTDVAGHWVAEDGWLYRAVEAGLMDGIDGPDGLPTGRFAPDESLTRAQAVTVLYRHACAEDPSLVGVYGSTTDATAFAATDIEGFSDDDPGSYYQAALAWAKATGVLEGDSDANGEIPAVTTARPSDPVSRAELAAMAHRYATAAGADNTGATSESYADASDAAEVPEWAEQHVGWCFAHGVLEGNEDDGTVEPAGESTRAEAAKVFVVALLDVLGA